MKNELGFYDGIKNWDFSMIKYIEENLTDWDLYRILNDCTSPNSKILDLGTGGGEKVLRNFPIVKEIIATDFSKEMINTANKNLAKTERKDITFKQMDNLNITTPDNYFDIVVARHTCIDAKGIYKTLKINTVYRLNKAISEGKAQDIISLSEALHEKKISDLADKIVERKDVKAILIAGPSSSGKTTFSKRLGVHLRLNGLKPVTISVDNYFVERKDNPKHSDGTYDFECIEAIDLKLFNEHLTKLLNGEEIDVPTFNFKTGHKEYHGEKMRLAQDEVLVMEGIHCLNDKLTEAISKDQKYKIYISALTVLNIDYFNRISTTDTRLIRRIVRDYQFRSYSALHTLETWLSVNQGEEKYIYPFQEDADSMFNTSLIYELCVLKKHAHPLLKEITNASKEFSEAKNLYNLLNYFEDIPDELVPKNSLLREFIGGSIYED